jgi:hypothetical protein
LGVEWASGGADKNLAFAAYADYLRNEHIVPAQSVDWVGLIRTVGNEANHEIVIPEESEVERVLAAVEMLLKLAYEFQARVADASSP